MEPYPETVAPTSQHSHGGDPLELQFELRKRGYTQAGIAKDLRKHESAVRAVVKGRGRSAAIEACIAALLEQPLEKVFPKWHGPNRRRRSRPIPLAARIAAAEADRRTNHR